MITIITGASYTGKTALAERLMIRTRTPYLSIDSLKAGLINSGVMSVDENDPVQVQSFIWPIVKEMIKDAIDKDQDLIVEGRYVPELWVVDFDDSYLQHIRYTCLVMSEGYIINNFESIKEHANLMQKREVKDLDEDALIAENEKYLEICEDNLYPYKYIDGDYIIDIDSLIM